MTVDSEIRNQSRGRRISFDEFVRKVVAAGTGYDIFRFGDAFYVEVRDRNYLFGFRFLRGELDGGWITPAPSDDNLRGEWGRWLEYLRGWSR